MSFTNSMVNPGNLGNESFLSCELNFIITQKKRKRKKEREETASIKSLKVWSTFSVTASLSFTLELKKSWEVFHDQMGSQSIFQSTAIIIGSRKKKKKNANAKMIYSKPISCRIRGVCKRGSILDNTMAPHETVPG